jgi:hypothetical protein
MLSELSEICGEVGATYRSADDGRRRFMLAIAAVCVLAFLNIAWAVASRLFSNRPATYGVMGTASVGGSAIDAGEVTFDPLVGENAQLRSARVKNGVFEIPASQGLPKNKKFTVRVYAFRPTGRKYENADPSQSAAELEQFVSEQYNTNSSIVFETTKASLATPLALELPDAALIPAQPARPSAKKKR